MWVFINKNLDENGRFKEVLALGSIKAIAQHGVVIDDKNMTYDQLLNRLSKTRRWTNENYYILECKLITSQTTLKNE